MDPNSPLVVSAKSLAAKSFMPILAVAGLLVAVIVAIFLLATVASTITVIAALTLIALAILLAIYLLASAPGVPPETLRTDFETEGVTVSVPWQGQKVRVEKLPLGTLDEVRAKQEEDFQPGRLVINFQVVEAESGTVLEDFHPPFDLRVKYKPEDEERAKKKGKPLELAFWYNHQWNRFAPQKHQFRLESGAGVAKVAKWGDPQIGWGP